MNSFYAMDNLVIRSLFHLTQLEMFSFWEKNPGEVFIKNSFQVKPAGQFSVSSCLMKTQVILRNKVPFYMKDFVLKNSPSFCSKEP